MRWLILSLAFAGGVAEAKNAILFLGDGMGVSTVTAARIFAGQLQGKSGEEHDLSFDGFDNVALIKTYNTNAQVSDSAGTITAILSGRKTRMGVLGVNAEVPRGNCEEALKNQLPTLLELAEETGKATGVVTTTRITHATPAGTYAHSPDRDWESRVPDDARAAGCRDIAAQMVEFAHGDGIEVMLGGGRAGFFPTETQDPEYADRTGAREDGRDLVAQWLAASNERTYVWNARQFADFNPTKGQLLGLFEPSHMQWEADRAEDPAGEPSLRDMTEAALERLLQDDDGFFLLVEGGRIDHGHHAGNAYRALLDTVAMDAAVERALEMVDLEETLVLVTADHSHTLTISGYPERGNPILGKSRAGGEYLPNADGEPYTTLTYANGPGYQERLPDLTEVDTTARDYRQVSAVPLGSETHAGEDVAAYATGKNATEVRGVMEQNKLYDALLGALFE
jgi:alkaline phosphatase